MTQSPNQSIDGTVVAMAGDQLTATNSMGKAQRFTVTKDSKVTCDGKPIYARDLAVGTNIRITTRANDEKTAIAIDSGKHITGTETALNV